MALKLEVFDDGAGPVSELAGSAELDDLRLESFDSGYRAGWEDATAALARDEAEIREAVDRNLQALSFTYHEARAHVLRALSPLIAGITARLLPEMARAALPQLVAEALLPYAELAAEAPVEVLAHPDACERIATLLGEDTRLPLVCRESANLSPGQVWLRLGEAETLVDIDAALTAIQRVLLDFFEPNRKESPHG